MANKKTELHVESHTAEPEKDNNLLIVGIGASAGGLEALQTFFQHVEREGRAAYVILLHTLPNQDTQLFGLLQQISSLPVYLLTEQVSLAADQIYILSPDKNIAILNNSVILSVDIEAEEKRAPVDIFFRTLAETKKKYAIGVILSGNGANGSMGLKHIKEQGGAVLVQNPREAIFHEMPRNAIATGLVDEILNVSEIPGFIKAYTATLDEAHIAETPQDRNEEDQQALREVFTQLRQRTGHDFSNYKRATLMRRIERRMAVRGLSQLPDYAEYANGHPEESQALLKDLLISVTNFFRDKTPFECIDTEVLPALFEHRSSEEQIRIWVAGCATGEEAYTMAILCAERTLGVVDAPKVQIFATDIDENAIGIGRDGFYSLNDAADVSSERLARFFNKEGEGYRIRQEIRETILFANHNFLKDPPFSRIDLISCRNVLIYLNRPAQERVMETFHFSLKPEGFLLLGTSESVDMAGDLFKVYNREHHIYQSRQILHQRPFIVPESAPQYKAISVATNAQVPIPNSAIPRPVYGELHFQLIEEYAPPSLVVNYDFDIVHVSPRAGRYLQLYGGEPTQAILKFIREELRAELRNGLYQAVQQKIPVNSAPLLVKTDLGIENVRIHVRPLINVQKTDAEKQAYLLVVFEPANDGPERFETVAVTNGESAARHLEDEVVRLRLQLRGSNEQHEYQAEELKAGNEELQAMNEELRSATEELETSKEELQSINEELRTVNQELKVKVEEATIISSNLKNLINSTDIGTIFLDRSLRVVLFTPAIRSVFNLIPADYGRPLSDITSKLKVDILSESAQMVLDKLHTLEQEVRTTDGRVFLARIAPYRTEEDKIQGVVISLLNITERVNADEALQQSYRRNTEILESISDAFFAVDSNFNLTYINKKAEELWARSRDTLIGRHLWTEFPNMLDDNGTNMYHQVMAERVSMHYESVAPVLKRWLDVSIYPDAHGGLSCYFRDITGRKLADKVSRNVEERKAYLLHLSDTHRQLTKPSELLDATLRILGKYLDLDRVLYNEKNSQTPEYETHIFDLKNEMVVQTDGYFVEKSEEWFGSGKTFVVEDVTSDQRLDAERKAYYSSINVKAFVIVPLNKKGEYTANLVAYSRIARTWNIPDLLILEDTAERLCSAIDRARTEEILRVTEERYRTALKSADMAAWDWNIVEDKIRWNDQHFLLLGIPVQDRFLDSQFFFQFVHPEDKKAVIIRLKQSVEESGDFRLEAFRIIRTDKELRWMSGYGKTVEWVNGKSARMVGVMYDITERKLLEQQKEHFIAIASHELRTPVTSIKAYAEILEEIFIEKGDQDNAAMMRKLDDQVDRLTTLINALLDTTSFNEGKFQLEKKRFAIDDLIVDTVENMQRIAGKHKIELVLNAGSTVHADRERLRQVLVNLLTNAIKYSPDAERVIVKSFVTDGSLCVTVEDFGLGISADAQENLFTRYFREKEKDNFSGLGLGLFISANIIKEHGGIIYVDSEIDKGSVFTFKIPMLEED